MKKVFTILMLCFIAAVAVQAQDYKKFRVGLGSGAAIPSGDGSKGGVLFYLEPGYRVSDDLIVGLRMEWAVMARGASINDGDVDASGVDFDLATAGSYTVNGQYYFMKGKFRPFAGLGFGIYKFSAVKLDDSDGESVEISGTDESKFGFYPRVGFDAGHFTLSLDYNLVGATKVEDPSGTDDVEFKNSYLGIRVGAFFGGGKK
jgi:outer membrane protein W